MSEFMDNERRADMALEAVETFTAVCHGDGEDVATMARDLLVNLLHLIKREEPDTDIDNLLTGTLVCYNEEVQDEEDEDV